MSDWIKQMVECLAPEEAVAVRLEEAVAIKYNNRPKSVFKYRRNNEKSRGNLENDLVWVCSPTSYNDPYDSSITIASETLTKSVILDNVKKFIEVLSEEFGITIDPLKEEQILNGPNPELALQELIMVDMDQLPPEDKIDFRESLVASMKTWEEAIRKELPAKHKTSLNICSFSGTHQSIIMWSHYADEHRGFCIEYNTESLSIGHPFMDMLYPVIYSEKLFDGTNYYLAAIRNQGTFNSFFPILAALHKSPEWSYEKEWRLVIPANVMKDAGLLHVPTPKRVYLGSKMSDEEKERVMEICRKKEIDIHQMYLADDSFCLRSELIVVATS